MCSAALGATKCLRTAFPARRSRPVLDRLGRGVLHLVALIEELRTRGVEFRSITEGMDTRIVIGQAMFQLVAVFAVHNC